MKRGRPIDGCGGARGTALADLSGRTAVVTGGAGPLGSVLCAALASAGARVILIDQAGADEAARSLPGDADHVAVGADLLDREQLANAVNEVEHVGACDILVNNAAFTGTSGVSGYAVPFAEQTDEAFELGLRLNLVVPFSLSRRLAPLLRESGGGSIVNVASIYGLVGPNLNLYEGTAMGNPAAYGASKGGLIQLTRYLAAVLAPQIRCNALAP